MAQLDPDIIKSFKEREAFEIIIPTSRVKASEFNYLVAFASYYGYKLFDIDRDNIIFVKEK